jgi:hypothetical protein
MNYKVSGTKVYGVKDTNKSNCLKEEKKANANLSTSQMGL